MMTRTIRLRHAPAIAYYLGGVPHKPQKGVIVSSLYFLDETYGRPLDFLEARPARTRAVAGLAVLIFRISLSRMDGENIAKQRESDLPPDRFWSHRAY